MSEDKKKLDCLREFIRVIADDSSTLNEIEQTLSAFSSYLHLGRLIGELEIDPNPILENGYRERKNFFICEDGFDSAKKYQHSVRVKEPGTVTITANPIPGFTFDGFYDLLDSLMELIYVRVARDFMDSKAMRNENVQALTGLPNASGYLKQVVVKYQLGNVTDYDAYYFNLKGFGLINKYYGQKEGDEIIRRFAIALRRFAAEDEDIGHLGGDNFVALIHKGERSAQFQKLLSNTKLYAIRYGEKVPLNLVSNIGFMHVENDTPLEQIISGAAVACSFAKRTRTTVVELTAELNERIQRRKQIEHGFDKALADHEFTVFYQPKVNAETGKLIGAEALTRWFEFGRIVPPGVFIPVLEESGDITKLDLAMFEIVCSDIAEWKKNPENHIVPISVNISRRDLEDADLAAKLLSIMAKYEVRDDIVIEITETVNEEEKTNMVRFLRALRANQVKTSIDDFGTGYSSLSVLKEFPISEIKLDRSFIVGDLNIKDAVIIRYIIRMANDLGIEVIQEGVETKTQLDFVVSLGCSRIQGFYYSRPLPRHDFDEWVKEGQAPSLP